MNELSEWREVAPLVVDQQTREVFLFGQKLDLQPQAYLVIAHMATHPRIRFSLDELYDVIYTHGEVVNDNQVNRILLNIRRKLSMAMIHGLNRQGWALTLHSSDIHIVQR